MLKRISNEDPASSYTCNNKSDLIVRPTVTSLTEDKHGNSISGLTKIKFSNYSIYVFARHSLVKYNHFTNKSIEGLIEKGYQLFEAQDLQSNHKLDVLFLSKNEENLKLALTEISNINFSDYSKWISWQQGSLGDTESGKQCSEGEGYIEGNRNDKKTGYYGLPMQSTESIKNFTSPGSSGSVVWLISNDFKKIFPFGVVQCLQKQPNGSARAEVIRVLGFDKIKNSQINEIKFDEALADFTNIETFQNCILIDRNGIGGN